MLDLAGSDARIIIQDAGKLDADPRLLNPSGSHARCNPGLRCDLPETLHAQLERHRQVLQP